MKAAPKRAMWSERVWQSTIGQPAAKSLGARVAKAHLEASVASENIDSPQKTPRTETP